MINSIKKVNFIIDKQEICYFTKLINSFSKSRVFSHHIYNLSPQNNNSIKIESFFIKTDLLIIWEAYKSCDFWIK